MSFSRNPLTITVHPQPLSRPPITVNLTQLSETSLAINQVTTHLPTMVMVVPTPSRAVVHHAARSAARKGTMLISATSGMHGVENLLAPQPTLPRPLRASCSLNGPEPSYWYMDTGASTHMTLDLSHLDQASNYTGKDRAVVRNGASLPITHTGTISHIQFLELLDVLVVPRLMKNVLSISKLTSDFLLAVTFTNNFFSI